MKILKKYTLFVLALVLIAALFPLSAAAESFDEAKSATFTGRGQVFVKADTATVNFCVETRGNDALDVKKENDKTVEKLKKELGKYCVNDDCFYTYTDPATGTVTATRSMTLFTDNVDGVGALTQNMLRNGATAINCVMYGLKDPTPHQDKALAIAIADAKSKAAALSIKLPLKEIIEFGSYSYSSGGCGDNRKPVTVESNVNVIFAE